MKVILYCKKCKKYQTFDNASGVFRCVVCGIEE